MGIHRPTPLTRYRNGFVLQKSRVTVVNNGKLCKTEGVRHVNGEAIKKVGEEWYKHLGMMEPDRVKENDMNDTLKYEYLPTLKFIVHSKLNGGSKMESVNTWTVALLRYGGVTGMTRMVMTINRSCTQEVILQKHIYQGIKREEILLAAKLESVGKKTI